MGITYTSKKAQVSDLFCDKLSFTIDYINLGERAHIDTEINELLSYKYATPYWRWPYKKGVRLYLGDFPSKIFMIILWEPSYSGAGYMRVDFNPNYADMEQACAYLIKILPGGLDDLHTKARITRFDVSFDIVGILPDEFLAYAPGKSISKVYCKSGKTETLELGASASPNLVVIYNKQLQVKEMNNKKKTKIPVPKQPTTRVEIRLKPGKDIEGLISIDNPLLSLVISPFAALSFVQSETWRLFVAVAQWRGAQDALLMLDENTRKIFRSQIESVKCDWYNPDAIWSTWQKLLSEVFWIMPTTKKMLAA